MATRPSALFVLLVCVWLSSTKSAAAQEVPISETAKLHFAVGVGLLEADGGPKYADAYESFRRAYRASPSPKILSNLGLCAMELERDGEAIDAYAIYLKEVSDIPPKERNRIEADLERLHAGLATLLLNVQPVGALIVDERIPDSGPSVINRYQFEDSTFELRIRAGQHKIRVESDGYKPQIVAVEVAPHDKHVRRIKLVELEGTKKTKQRPPPAPPAEAPPPASPTSVTSDEGGISGASIAMLVVTGALTAGAVVVGVLALSTKADYETFERGGSRQDAETVRANGEALNITTDVLIATAAASAVVSVVLLTTTRGGESAALRVAPTVGGGTIGLDVHF